MNNIDLRWEDPRWLLLLIPLVGLSLIPYFRLPKKRRQTKNRVISLVIHTLILILAAFLLAGAGLRIERELDSFDVILVADLSDSNEEAVDAMNRRIHSILSEEHAADFRIGIVTFAEDQVYASEPDTKPDRVYQNYISTEEGPNATATDIASALYYAKSLLGEVVNSRLILLSDGLETDGDALQAAAAIAEEGVRVYAVHTEHERPTSEVQLDLLELSEEPEIGKTVQSTVTLRSAAPGVGKLLLYDNGKRCAEMTVTLTGGTDSFVMSYVPTEAGLHELRAELISDADTLAQNNTVYSYLYIDISSRILIVDGTGEDARYVQRILSETYSVNVVSPMQVPRTLDELKGYSEVVLVNVDVQDLPAGYDEVLNTYVHDFGGGLFTVGGLQTYTLGCMAGTRFDDMLPIDMDDDDTHVMELMIVMDKSISMDYNAVGTDQRRIDIAKKGAVECCRTLKDSDYIGVITFSGMTEVLQELTPATNRESVIQKINGIETYPATVYYQALSLAQTALFTSTYRADKQHVIFITDGEPQDRGYLDIVRSMASRGITVSAIGISPDRNMKRRISDIAEAGNGRSYYVTNESMLPSIMKMETMISQRELINEKKVYPEYKDYSPVIAGIDRLPALEGYIGVGVKPEAKAVYTVGADPIYAEWRYGAGKVGSFMSDLGGKWSVEFLNAENGQLFLRNVVGNLEYDDENGELNVEFENDNYTTHLFVNKQAMEGHTVEARITDPLGEAHVITLNVAGGSRYFGDFSTKVPGIYTVYVKETDGEGKMVASTKTYMAFSYSAEYDAFADPLAGYEKLEALCRSADGRLLLPEEQIFSRETLVVTREHDLKAPLLIALILLFLLDIAVRKFRFKRLK